MVLILPNYKKLSRKRFLTIFFENGKSNEKTGLFKKIFLSKIFISKKAHFGLKRHHFFEKSLYFEAFLRLESRDFNAKI